MTRFALSVVLLLPLTTDAAGAQAPAQAPVPQAAPAAAEAPKGKLSGLVFGDYYSFPKQHLPAWEGQHGLWLRRVYLTYDYTFTPRLTTRLRLEMNSNGKLAGGSLEPYVKDAYLRWTFAGRQQLTAGIQPSLTFEFLESVWGLRHIEKTPVDLYRVDSSRDTGLTVSGPLNASRTLKYAAQYGNDSGNNAETDKRKGFRLAARYETDPGFSVEGMFGRAERADDADRTTAQLFGAWRTERGRVGAQYTTQKRAAPAGSTAADIDLDIMSGFGVVDLKAGSTSAFVRVDRYDDPCADCAGIDYLPIDTTQPFTMTLAGVEYLLHPSVRISPNVEWVKYSKPEGGATAPKDDLALRLTFFWSF